MIDYLFSCLGKSCMENFHLLGEIFLQPLVLFDVVTNELDGKLPRYLYGSLALALSIEPSLCPPDDAVLVGIYADSPLDVETLDINVKVLEWVDDALAFYSPVNNFFFSSSDMDERNTPCIKAR